MTNLPACALGSCSNAACFRRSAGFIRNSSRSPHYAAATRSNTINRSCERWSTKTPSTFLAASVTPVARNSGRDSLRSAACRSDGSLIGASRLCWRSNTDSATHALNLPEHKRDRSRKNLSFPSYLRHRSVMRSGRERKLAICGARFSSLQSYCLSLM